MKPLLSLAAAFTLLFAAACARAGQVEKLYEIRTSTEPSSVAANGEGKLSIKIQMKDGAHISDEAPLKVNLSAQNVKLQKDKVGRAEAQFQPDGPLFSIPFTAGSPGPASVEADMVFFICTEKLCERQAKKITIPVTIK